MSMFYIVIRPLEFASSLSEMACAHLRVYRSPDLACLADSGVLGLPAAKEDCDLARLEFRTAARAFASGLV